MKKASGLPRLTDVDLSKSSRESLNCQPVSKAQRDWIIGDKCHYGPKPAKIVFLGETRFGAGEWAGVVLEDASGKNDGSVNGVRYFQCAPNCGVFCRISKLSNQPLVDTVGQDSTLKEPSPVLQSTPERVCKSQTPPPIDASPVAPHSDDLGCEFSLGDNVALAGSVDKKGVLRFVGATKFAVGLWAGIELDCPTGKNDGSVQGERYFVCKPRYGVFVPANKLVAACRRHFSPGSGGSTSNLSTISTSTTASSRPPTMPVRHNIASTLRMQKGVAAGLLSSRAGSQESLCSLGSMQSTASKRVRLGVTSLNSPGHSRRESSLLPTIYDDSRGHDECHKKLAAFKLQMDQLCLSLEEKSALCKKVQDDLDEEKRKSEDLLFRLEEAAVARLSPEFDVNERHTLQDEINRLKSVSDKAHFDAKTFEQLFDEEERRLEDFKFRFEEEMAQKMLIQENLIKVQADLESANEQLKTISEEFGSLQRKLNAENDGLDPKMALYIEENDGLKLKLESTLQSAKQLEQTSNELQLQRDSFLGENAALKNAVLQSVNLKSEMAESQKTNENMKKQLAEFEQHTLQLSQQIQSLQRQNGDLEKKLECSILESKAADKLRKEVEEAKLESQTHKDEAAKFKQDLDSKTSQLSSQIKHCETEVSNLKQIELKCLSLTEKLSQAKSDLENFKEMDKKCVALTQKYETAVIEHRNFIRETEANQAALNSDCSQLRMANENCRLEIGNLEQKLKLSSVAQSEGKDEASRFSEDLATKIDSLTTENASLKQQLFEHLAQLKLDEAIVQEQLTSERKNMGKLAQDYNVLKSQHEESSRRCEAELSRTVEQLENMKQKFGELKDQNDASSAQIETFKSQNDHLVQKLEKAESAMEKLGKKLVNQDLELLELGKKLAANEASLQSERLHSTSQRTTLQQEVFHLKGQLEEMRLEHASDQIVQKAHEELQSSVDDLTKAKLDLQAKLAERVALHQKDMLGLQTQNSALKGAYDELENKHVELIGLQRELNDRIQKHQSIETSHANLSQNLIDLQKQNLDLTKSFQSAKFEQKRLEDELSSMISEKTVLERELRERTEILLERGKQMENLGTETEHLKQECAGKSAANLTLREHCSILERTVVELEMDVKNLTQELADANSKRDEAAQAALSAADLESSKLSDQQDQLAKLAKKLRKSEKLAAQLLRDNLQLKSAADGDKAGPECASEIDNLSAERQVAFLNAVIADLTRKNHEMQVKVDVFYSGTVGQESLQSSLTKAKPKPRMFCDICDLFDAHETEDCPKQSGSVEGGAETASLPAHSKHQGTRGAARDYCEKCEVFGHTSDKCDDESY